MTDIKDKRTFRDVLLSFMIVNDPVDEKIKYRASLCAHSDALYIYVFSFYFRSEYVDQPAPKRGEFCGAWM